MTTATSGLAFYSRIGLTRMRWDGRERLAISEWPVQAPA